MCFTKLYYRNTQRYHLLKMVWMGWFPITRPVSEWKYLPWKNISDARQMVDVNDSMQMEAEEATQMGATFFIIKHHISAGTFQLLSLSVK